MNKKTYFNVQSISFEKQYDFIIGEHLKGRKYAMSKQKSLINQTKEENYNGTKKQTGIL